MPELERYDVRHSAKIGMLQAAILIGAESHPKLSQELKPEQAAVLSARIRWSLDREYRSAYLSKDKPSRAAHYKRLAKKRENVRARGKK